MPIVVENGKEIYYCPWGKFPLEKIAISWNIKAPKNLKKEDLQKYEIKNRKHYDVAQYHFFEDRQWLLGCEEHREIKPEELNGEIAGPLSDAFHWCYFEMFKNDETKVKKLEEIGPVAA